MSFLCRRFVPINRQLNIGFSRSLSSAVAVAEDKKVPASKPGNYFSKVSGWLPLAAIGGTIALSKELLILNEEVLILFTFSTTVFGLYTQIGGVVAKTLDDRAAKIANDLSQVLEKSSEVTKEQAESAKKLLTLPEDIDAIFKQQEELMNRYIAAIPNQIRANLNSQIKMRLSMIAEKEGQFMRGLQEQLADAAAAAVREQLKSGNQKALLTSAIKALEAGSLQTKEDPVREQFVAYFSSFQKKVASKAGKDVPLDEQQKAEWKAALDDLLRRDPNLKQLDVKVPDKIAF